MGSRRATLKLRNSSPHLHVGKNTRRETLFTPLLYEAARSNMPYTYQGWTLYSRDVKLKKGPKVTIYFFSKRKPKSGKPMDEMPKNRKIGVNKRTGLPFLRKGWVQSREPHPPRQNGGGPRHISLLTCSSMFPL